MRKTIVAFGLCVAAAVFAPAAAADTPQAPPVVQETETDRQVREIARQLRCAVCQSESVADSNSQLARNMRDIIRERVEAGDSPAEVKAYFVSKYGDYILMEPRRTGLNWALWLFPVAAFLAGTLIIAGRLRKRGRAPDTSPAPEAQAPDHTQELIAALREPAAEKDTETK